MCAVLGVHAELPAEDPPAPLLVDVQDPGVMAMDQCSSVEGDQRQKGKGRNTKPARKLQRRRWRLAKLRRRWRQARKWRWRKPRGRWRQARNHR